MHFLSMADLDRYVRSKLMFNRFYCHPLTDARNTIKENRKQPSADCVFACLQNETQLA